MVITVVAVSANLRRPETFRLSAGVPELLEQLAKLNFTSSSNFLEGLVAKAEGPLVHGEDDEHVARFIARVKVLAAGPQHPRADVRTGYYLGSAYVEGIRQLQNALVLPRIGLVVEYLVRAAWDVEGDDDGGEGDELQRRRRAGSRNLHNRRPAAPSVLNRSPLPGQLRLLKVEEQAE